MDYVDKKRIADAEENAAKRNAAVDDQKSAKTEDQFDKDQDTIVGHLP